MTTPEVPIAARRLYNALEKANEEQCGPSRAMVVPGDKPWYVNIDGQVDLLRVTKLYDDDLVTEETTLLGEKYLQLALPNGASSEVEFLMALDGLMKQYQDITWDQIKAALTLVTGEKL